MSYLSNVHMVYSGNTSMAFSDNDCHEDLWLVRVMRFICMCGVFFSSLCSSYVIAKGNLSFKLFTEQEKTMDFL